MEEMPPPEVAIARMEGTLEMIRAQIVALNEKIDAGQAASAAAHSALKDSVSALSARIEPFERRYQDQKLLSRVGYRIVTVLAGIIIAIGLMAKGEWIAAWSQIRAIVGG